MLKDRYLTYLKRQPYNPVSREELIGKAIEAGYPEKQAKKVLYEIKEEDAVDVGTWYGARIRENTYNPEPKTLWFCYYDLTDEEREAIIDNRKWFDSL